MLKLTRSAILRHIGYRIVGYLTILITYYFTISAAYGRVQVQLPLHPELQKRLAFKARYITIWNVLLQIVYAIISLACDVTTLLHMESVVPASMRKYRYKCFAGLFFPMSFFIVTFFWPVYSYDRELIYPEIADLVVAKWENIMHHFGILIFVFWEITFLPQNSHIKRSIDAKIATGAILLYLATTLYTGFVDMKSFPYDILNVTVGTVWFYVILASAPVIYYCGYYVQWWYRDAVWRYREEDNMKIK